MPEYKELLQSIRSLSDSERVTLLKSLEKEERGHTRKSHTRPRTNPTPVFSQ